MNPKQWFLLHILFLSMLASCSILHHYQVGEIDNSDGKHWRYFDLKVNEVGLNTQELANIGKSISTNKQSQELIQNIRDIIALFQMGPRTGNPVYNDEYAENLAQTLYQECPNGKMTGLQAIRETRKYPVISGEIIKITGYCQIN